MKVNERIKRARKEARLTQDQIAEQLDITKGAVSQWESGKTTPRNDLLRKFARITNKPLDWLMGFNSAAGFWDVDEASPPFGKVAPAGESLISVYDYKAFGDNSEALLGEEPLFMAACPPPLQGVKGIYAIVVSSGSMAPRYEEGEVIFVDPTRHVRPDDYIVVRLRHGGGNADKDGPAQFVIGRLVHTDSEQVAVRQLNPDMVLYYPADQVSALELVVIASAIR